MGTLEGIVFTVIALLAAVLLELTWIYYLPRFRRGRKADGHPTAGPEPQKDDSVPWTDQIIKSWVEQKDRWKEIRRWLRRGLRPVLLGVILLLGTIPSLLVVLDRWFNLEEIHYLLTDLRCKVPLLCDLPLPEYFLLILLCLLAVGLLIALFPLGLQTFLELRPEFPAADDGIPAVQIGVSRLLRWLSLTEFVAVALLSVANHRIPGVELALVAGMYVLGWFLRDVSLARVRKILRENRAWLFACLLAHVALVAALAAYYSSPSYLPIGAVGLVLAVIFLFRYRHRIPMIYWIYSLGLILFSININAWWVSVAGDEYGFYENARGILGRTDLSFIASHWFDEMGVYGQNPYFASIVQGIFMRVFGIQSFGWRFSNVYLIALSIPFFFLFLKTFLDRRVALLACFFLATSQYLINFSKIGYVSLQALFAVSISLAAAAWAVRSGRMAAFALTGIVLAMNFYVYGIAIVSIPLALLLVFCFAPPFSRPALRRWAVLIAGFGILFFPLCFQPDYWRTGFGLTIFGSLGNNPLPGGPVQFLANRILASWFSYLYVPNESHFVSVSFVDWMTAAFIGIGFFAVLYRIRRSRFAVFFLLGWVLLLTVAGIIGSPDLPSTTRMFVVLPWWAAAAAFGLWWLRDQILSPTRPGGKILGVIFGGFLAIVVVMNLIHATVVSYDRWMDRQPFESFAIRLAKETQSRSSGASKKFVFLTYADWSMDPFIMFKDLYPRDWASVELEKVVIEGPRLPETAIPIVTDPKSVILVIPTLPEEWQAGLRTSLQALGDEYCPVYTPSGKWEYDLYAPKEMAWVCSKPH